MSSRDAKIFRLRRIAHFFQDKGKIFHTPEIRDISHNFDKSRHEMSKFQRFTRLRTKSLDKSNPKQTDAFLGVFPLFARERFWSVCELSRIKMAADKQSVSRAISHSKIFLLNR